MSKITVGTVDVAVGRRLQNDEARLNHRSQQFRQYPVKQFRKFGKFGKYWTTVVVPPFFICSTDLTLKSGFLFKLSRPDSIPGWRLSFASVVSESGLPLASVAKASKKAKGSGPTLDPAMACPYPISRGLLKNLILDRAAILNFR
jgi:hypothetical protein